MSKLGLVLSGGGAKGAYHVGVIKALQELDTQIDMLSGASIGALNGAVLLSAKTQEEGLQNLEQLWDKLPEVKPIQLKVKESLRDFVGLKKTIDASTYISLLLASGLKLATPIGIPAALLTIAFERLQFKSLEGFCKQEPLAEMMEEFLNLSNLNSSIPFYISTYKIKDCEKALDRLKETFDSIFDFLKAEILGLDSQFSEFYKIQGLNELEQKSYILASAALPLIFEPQRDGKGNRFIDGGLGGALKSQGNTPITPLIEAGCTHVIVSHLDHASLWHRYDYPQVNIIEIRPNEKLDLSGAKLLDFSRENIETLKVQGYLDTKAEMERISRTLINIKNIHSHNSRVKDNLHELEKGEKSLDAIMKLL
ncbi:patatin-like phospholipase family protein [Acinetobacter bereziniae]|uniref:patatin-like phospholipase family protein n=1 Tax=Acinetobacter bereziniae TaxID=106648 RepID=UPI00300A4FBC